MENTVSDLIKYCMGNTDYLPNWRKDISKYLGDKERKPFEKYVKDMLKATVYTITGETAKYAFHASLEFVPQFPKILASAKPSLPVMFINDATKVRVDEATRNRGLEVLNPGEVVPTGYLILDHPAEGWVEVTPIAVDDRSFKRPLILHMPFHYAFSYTGDLPEELLDRSRAMADVCLVAGPMYDSKLWTRHEQAVELLLGWKASGPNDPLLKLLNNRIALCPSHFGTVHAAINKDVTKLSAMFRELLKDLAGDVRYIITMLALLNDFPNTVERRESRGRMKMKMGKTPKREPDSLVHLHVVERRTFKGTISGIRKTVLENNKRRLHTVRGHWSYYGAPEHCGSPPVCRFPDKFEKRQTCATCGARRTYVEQHQRGDARLGSVRTAYLA